MRVVADGNLGIILVFKDENDLSKVIEHLQGMQQWKMKEKSPYPAAYLTSPNGLADETTDAYLAQAKLAIQ